MSVEVRFQAQVFIHARADDVKQEGETITVLDGEDEVAVYGEGHWTGYTVRED